MKTFLWLLAVVLLLPTCEQEILVPHPTGEAAALLEKAAMRPFKGSVDASLGAVDLPCFDCPYLIGGGAGVGNITHLGKVNVDTESCIEQFVFDETGKVVEVHVAGTCAIFTAANGDELQISSGPHVFVHDPTCNCDRSTFPATVTGGTGRFSDATGTIQLSTAIYASEGRVEESYQGWIDY